MTQVQGKLGLVLSGGGGRGAFEAGVISGLWQDPRFRDPDIVTGTSAGAINAALIAANRSPEQIRDFWFELEAARAACTNDSFVRELGFQLLKLGTQDPMRTLRCWRERSRGRRSPAGLVSSLVEVLLTDRFDLLRYILLSVRETSLADNRRLRSVLVDAFGGERVQSKRALAINAVDARTNRAVRFVTRRTPRTRGDEYVVVPYITVDMVLASLSIPLFFPAISLEGRLLWDGGVLNNTPLAPAVALGAERVVPVLVTSLDEYDMKCFDSLESALERLIGTLLENAYNVDRQVLLARNGLAGMQANSLKFGERRHEDVELYEAIRPARDTAFDAGSLLDFSRNKLEYLYQHGRSSAAAWLRTGPRLDGPTTISATQQVSVATAPLT